MLIVRVHLHCPICCGIVAPIPPLASKIFPQATNRSGASQHSMHRNAPVKACSHRTLD